jgi:hypothetical protein
MVGSWLGLRQLECDIAVHIAAHPGHFNQHAARQHHDCGAYLASSPRHLLGEHCGGFVVGLRDLLAHRLLSFAPGPREAQHIAQADVNPCGLPRA